ncbi:unnamed protein product [Prunus armeniaca]|uniref:Pectinesterase inhibitor domain-containing protein n=1 Tax=Prunus armeniaca TaxID=36596 RepID=A0A6J5VB16_PRUAR|nr:unnamed protein product [Prunus armeniaca]
MVMKTCTEIEDQNSCLTNVQAELKTMAPDNQNSASILTAAIRHTLNEARAAIQRSQSSVLYPSVTENN